ncbi:MAG TPA: hypothetical protein VMD30_13820 [Tepidisphaeraceae bacterium]|nr:hypothetical protein [Tepidisphaeraceae bacterium]
MSWHADAIPPVPPIPPTVTSDTPCRKCQYNLRSLSTDSRCPECGTPVGFSVRGDLIRYSDPDWVDRIRLGLQCLVGVLALIDMTLIGGILLRIMEINPPMALGYLVLLGIGALLVAGPWFLTTPDPSGLGEDRYGRSRKFIRFCLITAVAGIGLMAWGHHAGWAAEPFIQLLAGAAELIGLAGNCAMANYVSKLALRIPDFKLASNARGIMWGLGCSTGLLVAFFVVGVVHDLTNGPLGGGVPEVWNCFVGIDCLVLLIFSVAYLSLFDQLRIRLREQSALARRTWAAAKFTQPAA